MTPREKTVIDAALDWFASDPQARQSRHIQNESARSSFNAFAVALIELHDSNEYDKMAPPPNMEDAYKRGYSKGFDDGYKEGRNHGDPGV